MNWQHMRLETDGDGIAVLTLDQAGRRVNVIDDAWMHDFGHALDLIRADASLTGLMILSAKKHFLAGADLAMLEKELSSITPVRGYEISQRISGLFRQLELLELPVVAAIMGGALGGGLELALACDYRIMANDPASIVGLPEVNLGLLPGAGGTQRLPRMIGVPAALDVLLSGRSIDAAQALELGIVDDLVSAEDLLASARKWLSVSTKAAKPWDAKGFAPTESRGLLLPEVAASYSLAAAGVAGSAGYDNPAPIAALSSVFEGMQLPFDRGLQIESKYFGRLVADGKSQAIVRSQSASSSLARNDNA